MDALVEIKRNFTNAVAPIQIQVLSPIALEAQEVTKINLIISKETTSKRNQILAIVLVKGAVDHLLTLAGIAVISQSPVLST